MLVGSEAEVLNSLSGVLGSSEKECVASSRSSKGQLIQSQSLTSGSNNAGTGSGSESESGYTELGDGQETVVIGNGANDDNGLVVGLLGGVRDDSRDGNGRSVDARHKKTAQDDLIEGRVGPAGQETVELYEQLQVDIVALGGLSVGASHMVSVEIDTYY